jgi:hypothetical protein
MGGRVASKLVHRGSSVSVSVRHQLMHYRKVKKALEEGGAAIQVEETISGPEIQESKHEVSESPNLDV